MKTCCGLCSLQKATKTIAIISVIFSLLSLREIPKVFQFFINSGPQFNEQTVDKIIELVFDIAELFLSFVLLYGAWKRKLSAVRVWLWAYFILVILFVILSIIQGLTGETLLDQWIYTSGEIVVIIFCLYFVNEFRKELIAEEATCDLSSSFIQEV